MIQRTTTSTKDKIEKKDVNRQAFQPTQHTNLATLEDQKRQPAPTRSQNTRYQAKSPNNMYMSPPQTQKTNPKDKQSRNQPQPEQVKQQP